MLLNRGIIPWIVPVMNVKLVFVSSDCKIDSAGDYFVNHPWIVSVINVKLISISSDCKILFNTNIELYNCAVCILFAIYYMDYRS